MLWDRQMKIGYVGLGVMGGALARRLQSSRDLRVYDLNPDAVAGLVGAGASAADSPASLARDCDVVMLCLPTSAHVREAIFGERGLAEGLKAGAIVVDQTSGDPNETRRMAVELAGRSIEMVDAPVSGGAAGAKAGTIAIMVGGGEAQLASVRPILADISPNVFHCGGIGAGQVMKLINNMVSSTIRMVTLEGVAMGVRNGIDLQTMTDVLNSGGARSRVSENLLPAVIRGRPDSFFLLSLMLKDLNLATQLGVDSGVPLHYGHLTRAMLQTASNTFGPDANYYEVTRLVAMQAGVEFPAPDSA
ncbi:MAG: NAD(P)-dependent oxidoreductase [Burkholderiaceae bacterium]